MTGVRYLILLIIILPVVPIRAQVYYYGSNDRPAMESVAIKKIVLDQESEKKTWIYTYINENGKWKEIKREMVRIKSPMNHIVNLYQGKLLIHRTRRIFIQGADGKLEFQDRRLGKVMLKGGASSKIPLLLEGMVTEFYDNGRLKSESFYRDNQLVWNKNWLRNGDGYIDSIFYSVDKWPVYKGGDLNLKTYLHNYIVGSPYYSRKINGTVIIGFTIMEDGELRGIRIMNDEVTRIAMVAREGIDSLPGKWDPALLGDRKVRCFMTFPINFIQKTNMMFDEIEIIGNMMFYNYR